MRRNRKLIVVDFDNTLFFTNRASFLASKELLSRGLTHAGIHRLPEGIRRRIYHLAATKYGRHSILNKALRRRLARARDAEIMILTARHNSSDAHTKMLLVKHGLNISKFRSRSESEMNIDDGQWKGRVIARIAAGYQEVEVYEDKRGNIGYMRDAIGGRGVRATFYIVTPRSIRKVGG